VNKIAHPQTPRNVHGRTPRHSNQDLFFLNRIPTTAENTEQIRQRRETPFSFRLGGEPCATVLPPTGGESYYGRKAKCKRFARIFFYIFFTRSLLTTEVLGSVVESKTGLTASYPAYETLCRKRRTELGWRMGFRSRRLLSGAMNYKTTNACVRRRCWPVVARLTCSRKFVPLVLLPFLMAAIPLASRTKEKLSYGEGLIVNIPVPEAEVVQVVQEVVQNGVIRGTKEYNKDQFVGGAIAADSSNVFPAGDQKGKVFYKVRMHANRPRNFKDSGTWGLWWCGM